MLFAWHQVKPIHTINFILNFMVWFYLKIIADAVKSSRNFESEGYFPADYDCLKRRMMACERVEYRVLKNNREELAYRKNNTLFSDKTNRFIKDWYSHLFFSTNVIIRKWCQKSTEQKKSIIKSWNIRLSLQWGKKKSHYILWGI